MRESGVSEREGYERIYFSVMRRWRYVVRECVCWCIMNERRNVS